jgi:glycine/D-amino acid oxidase-like deaminating enzyme
VDVTGGTGSKPPSKKLAGVEWADLGVRGSRDLGTEETIAQVLPDQLVTALLKGAREAAGSEVRIGTCEGVAVGPGGVSGLVVDGETLDADVVVVAMGPWTHVRATRALSGAPLELP